MGDIVLKVEGLSKLYRLGEVGIDTLSDDLKRWWYKVRGKEDPFGIIAQNNIQSRQAENDYVWALRDINLEVEQGEILGIIGRNGAGKSTLLKILSKITSPTEGRIRMIGRVGSLLEVGTGMHSDLTARENIYLNGAILGMSKNETRKKFDQIIDFSGIAMYIDTPVKRFSSGMRVRLGFAVAAFLEPEILIVDEVLAVGDAEFHKKAIGKIKEATKKEGRTVLFVSHNMASIQNLCSRIIVLDQGKCTFDGDVEEGISKYLNQNQAESKISIHNRKNRTGNGLMRFEKVQIHNKALNNQVLRSGDPVDFIISLQMKETLENVMFRMIVADENEITRFVCNNANSQGLYNRIQSNNRVILTIKKFPLPPGKYYYHLKAQKGKDVLDDISYAGSFHVEPGDYFGTGKVPKIKDGVFIEHQWTTQTPKGQKYFPD